MSLALSVLDLIPLRKEASSSQALRDSLALAREVDRLGYQRLWYAEHHNMPTIVSTTPAIMIALAAEATERIRVGSGGVMLPNHAPLAVAEAFKMLEALHPGRIDLGIGRAPGTDQAAALALRGSIEALQADDFPEKLALLMAFGQGTIPEKHPLSSVSAMPPDAPLPPIWLLGSSHFSAQLAAMLGTGYGFAAHFSDLAPEGPMLGYRQGFNAEGARPQPHAILTLSVICAETDAEAEREASSLIVSFTRLRTGQRPLLLSPEEALKYPFTPMERAVANALRSQHLIGSPETVKARIDALAASTEADEVMVSSFFYSPEARVRSYELLAEAYGLS